MFSFITKLPFLIFFLILPFISDAQHLIKGKIVRKANGENLEGVQIFIEGSTLNTKTNNKGQYSLKVKPSSKRTITIATFYPGLKSKIKSVVLDKPNIRLDFSLEELSEELKSVEITAEEEKTFGIRRLSSVEGFGIYDAKKNEVVVLKDLNANLATNSARQIFSKVAGLNVWESDGFGLQLEIGARGLSPKRSADFNIRQNGYDISADPIGYPESYYSPPAEALEQIQIIRGAASLQYGPQFGGMVNFVLKKPPKDKKISLTSRQSVGSFGLFNSFNRVSGTVNKLSYTTYFHYKKADGWRPNSKFDQYNYFANLNYEFNDKLSVGLEYTKMKYDAKQPGGLTDDEFKNTPLISNRNRNWFEVDWNLFSVNLDYRITDKLRLNTRNFGLLASRKALGLLSRIDRPDDPDTNRDLLWDDYKNFGNETRLLYTYYLTNTASTLLIGSRYFQGNLHRMQGHGDKSDSPNFSFVNNDNVGTSPDTLLSDYKFPNRNYALFVENIFSVNEKLTITPGVRYEKIITKSDGYYLNSLIHPNTKELLNKSVHYELKNSNRDFLIFGLGIGWKPRKDIEIYTNISQNFKGVNYNDLRVINPNVEVDPELKDERGYNMDLGMRGNILDNLSFDISGFILRYNDKIGTSIIENTLKRKKKNLGSSQNIGVESFLETDILKWFGTYTSKINIYSNITWLSAEYLNSEDKNIDGNRVELVPEILARMGINYEYKTFKSSLKYSYTSEQYTDAQNSTAKDNSAVSGLIPAYEILDLSLKYRFKAIQLETGINNLLNKNYFTRRADGYPGPGILPSSPRAYYFAIQLQI